MSDAKTIDDLLVEVREAVWALMDAKHEREMMGPEEASCDVSFFVRKACEHHARQMIGPVKP